MRHVVPMSAGILLSVTMGAPVRIRRSLSSDEEGEASTNCNLQASSPIGSFAFYSPTRVTHMEGSRAYEHDAKDFDYYLPNPTVDDLPVLLHKFDHENQEVWPWIWTHPNENGPHHVFIGKTITSDIVHRIQKLRSESPRNNILILITDKDEASLHRAAVEAGTDEGIFARCHCGIVTGVSLTLLNVEHKILMLDDERVVAFDYLTIC